MLRETNAQEALLLNPTTSGISFGQESAEFLHDESFVEMRFTASGKGALGTAKIYNDGSFSFKSHGVSIH